ncbi:MAG TPA: YdcF family protein [Bryobacteraceae bacterium]|jgi:uncharacterized SAM-binding protein YcdF (DUF218 family)
MAVVAALWIFSTPILRGAGSQLVADGPPVKADAIVVLAGDGKGNRILKGAELGKEGYAPIVIASNGGKEYDRSESTLEIEFAVHRGYAPELFLATDWDVYSTVEEAKHAVPLLRARGAHKVLIVTSLWHTARSGRIFRRLAPDIEFHLVGADDPDWDHGNWWRSREGKKEFLLEFSKTVADYVHL